jgi:hypothetical protein
MEICVPDTSVLIGRYLISQFRLFESLQIENFDNYDENKRGCPRLQWTSCITPPCTLSLLSDKSYGLEPLANNLVSHKDVSSGRYYSRQVLDILPSAKVADLPMPRFPPFLAGLRQRFLSAEDDIAMIAVEQLVDGMDLVNDWLERNLSTAPLEIRQLVSRLSLGKKSRIDVFLGQLNYMFHCHCGRCKFGQTNTRL